MRYLAAAVLLFACGGGGGGGGEAPDAAAGSTIDAAPGEDLDMQAADFQCITAGSHVRMFYLWNPLGHLDDALAVANDASGGTYPVGTVIQLVPMEAMVKRRAGFNPASNDWEFFALSVSGQTTTITTRGTTDVVNAFGGNCFDCHAQAEPQWDLICESTHGCAPLPIDDATITNIQNNDSRCP